MTTDPQGSESPEKFHFPPYPDEDAMRRYRNLPDPVELARLAALLASPAKPSTPTAQVEAALDLSLEAQEATIRRREAMVTAMDSTTLISLKSKLLAELHESGMTKREDQLAHTLAGPVMRESERRSSQAHEDYRKSDAVAIKAALEQADQRNSPRKRPALPCSLAQALPYAAAEQEQIWPVLDRAFRDFLVVCAAEHVQDDDSDNAADARAWIQRHEASLETPSPLEAEKMLDSEVQRKHHEEEIDRHKQRLSRIEARLRCAQAFTPNTPVPPELRKAAEATYAKYWSGPEAVPSDQSLAWVAKNFYAFWAIGGSTYLKQHQESEETQKAQQKLRALGGKAATIKREHGKWTSFAQAFVDWAKQQPTGSDLRSLAKSYPKQHGVDERRGRELLNTLITALQNPSVIPDLPNLLRGEEFDAGPATRPKINIGEETISECLGILRRHAGPRS